MLNHLWKIWRIIFVLRNISSPDISIKEITAFVRRNYRNNDYRASMFAKLCRERLLMKPLQYIINEWDFRFIVLHLKYPVFIPRTETEMLVDIILTHQFNNKCKGNIDCKRFLEIGCGSGAISLSLLRENKYLFCTAIDKSSEAHLLTLYNFNLYNGYTYGRFNIINIDVENFTKNFKCSKKFDFIVSNPPYIPFERLKKLPIEVRDYEPHLALDGGYDGLMVVRTILQYCNILLDPGGCLYIELDIDQPRNIEFIIKNLGFANILEVKDIIKDFSKRDRFAIVCRT